MQAPEDGPGLALLASGSTTISSPVLHSLPSSVAVQAEISAENKAKAQAEKNLGTAAYKEKNFDKALEVRLFDFAFVRQLQPAPCIDAHNDLTIPPFVALRECKAAGPHRLRF